MINQLTQFAAQIAPFAITGVIASAIVQAGKQFLAKTGHKVLLLVAVSLILGAVTFFIHALPDAFLTDAAGILASANAIYVLVIQWFESDSPVPPTPPTPA
jgi:hypothetical protein